MDADPPFISFIIPCKGRLAHLKETLPALVGQEGAEIIVVDYDCPDQTAQWLQEHHPQCVAIAVTDKSTFNISDARNIGLKAARGTWLFFLDADIVLSTDLVSKLRDQLSERHFYLLERFRHLGAYGSVLVTRAATDKVGAWDSRYVGYGGEDYDFFQRLTYAGLSMGFLRGEPAGMIPHSREERTRFHSVSKSQSLSTARLYGAAKRDLIKIHRSANIPGEVLSKLRAECEKSVQQALDEGRTTTRLVIHLEPERPLFPEQAMRRPTVRRTLIVEIDLER